MISLNYEIIGEGFPIIFLHGLSLDLTSWKLLVEPILVGSHIQRIYVDLPGHGKSKAGSVKGSDDVLVQLQELVAELNFEQYAIAGHSYGGYLARALAYADSRVTSLFLSAPVIFALKEDRKLAQHQRIVEEEVIGDAGFNALNVIISAKKFALHEELNSSGADKFDTEFAKILNQNYQLVNEQELFEKPTEVFTTIITGKYDNVVGYEDQFSWSKNCNEADYLCLANAGHNLQVDQTEKYLKVFKNWLINLE